MSECDFVRRAVPGIRALMPYEPGKPESELRRELGLDKTITIGIAEENTRLLEVLERVLTE